MLDATLNVIGNGNTADYTSPSAWEAGEISSLSLSVAVMAASPTLSDRFPRLVKESEVVPGDFALFGASGDALLWKRGDAVRQLEVPIEALLQREVVSTRTLRSKVKKFIRDNYDEDARVQHPRFRHADLRGHLAATEQSQRELTGRLVDHLATNPRDLEKIGWRDFEVVLATVFRQQGFSVTLGPGRADRGVDVRLLRVSGDRDYEFVVQAKFYRADRTVGLQAVQALYGVVEAEDAVGGLLVTTGRIESGAQAWSDRVAEQLSIAQSDEVVGWIQAAAGARALRADDAPCVDTP